MISKEAILVIDDEPNILEFLKINLELSGYPALTASCGKDAMEIITKECPAIILSDIRLPDINGIEILESVKECCKDIHVILMTAYQDIETTIKAMQAGAFDYISKPINMDELDVIIKRAIADRQTNERLEYLSEEAHAKYDINIIGKSKGIMDVFKLIGMASHTKATVLIQGETGVGKELVARAIHYHSSRKDKPFVAVNCSTIVETLLESELFGHEKGAFTGASYLKKGRFEIADGGTIFLDEVGDIPLNMQSKLLRIIQERRFERVGGEKTIDIDVRLIAATNRNLNELIKQNLFREDLYYRLNVFAIDIMPLRQRKEDIPILAEYFINKMSRELHSSVKKIAPDAMDTLLNYEWKGNVRELENVITRAMLHARGNVILKEHLSGDLYKSPVVEEREDYNIQSLEEIEKNAIAKTLEAFNWHKGKVCEALGLNRPRLERKIRKYKIFKQNIQS